jgi:hypothetical protein
MGIGGDAVIYDVSDGSGQAVADGPKGFYQRLSPGAGDFIF